MKRILALVLVLALVPCVASSDSPVNFSSLFDSMTYEELLAVNSTLQLCLMEKATAIDGVMIEPGMYEVGVDIPAGNYYFEGVRGRYYTNVSVYPSIERTGVLDQIQAVSLVGYSPSCQTTKTGKFILKDGWFVEIVQGPAIIRVFTGLIN